VSLSTEAFRRILGSLAAGVCVVTVRHADGTASGMTATSVTSLSLAPPLLLVCVGHDAAMHDIIVRAEWFGLNILAASQQDVAEQYATRGRQQFGPGAATTPAGLPRIAGAIGVVDCRRTDTLRGGDHSIVIGQLEWDDTPGGAPLLHFRGGYTRLG
jgi:flavin reductase (DIM6/NTAB) family NADH-FMN oxidoreductase RutF